MVRVMAGPVPSASPRALRRSRGDRVIAGVCGGLGRYVGVDPILLRVAFVVLAIGGGAGFLIYAAAWLVIPNEAPGEQLEAAPRSSAAAGRVLVGTAIVALGAILLDVDQTAGEDRSDEAAPPGPPPPSIPLIRPPIPSGRLLLGVVVLAGGVLWMLGTLDVFEVSVWVVLSIALIVVGLALLAGSRTGAHGGLVTLGVVLVVLLGVGSSFDANLRGGIGDRSFSPTSVTQLKREYRLGIGQLTLDLTNLSFSPGVYRIEATVGIGQLAVRLPQAGGSIHATAGVGDVDIAGRTDSGFNAVVDVTPAGGRACSETPCVHLELSVGIGQVTADAD